MTGWQSLVYCTSLENWRRLIPSVGSNPTPVAILENGGMVDTHHITLMVGMIVPNVGSTPTSPTCL